MPELPDVEGFRQVLADHAAGRRVQHVDALDTGVLREVSASRLQEVVTGRRLGTPRRHGKWLVAPVTGTGSAVLLHFGMTGELYWAERDEDRHRHDRLVFGYRDGELRYRDMRKLQGVRLTRDQGERERILGRLGPDALAISRDQLRESVGGRRRQVKVALMDQTVIAGLGNLLADEILWRSRIHPRRLCVHIGPDELRRLHGSMRSVLRQSSKDGRVPPRKSWLTGRRDEPSGSCPRCGTTLTHDRVGGRGTTWCRVCQRE